MIPLILRLRNFMSYGDRTATLDFDTFHVACLCGENGHGKSALLDAITWALWGRSRARSEDDLVQLGKQDMEVELHFALGDTRYCVLRKRTLRTSGKRRIAVPTLELQVETGDGYRPLTEESVGATQAQIQRILRVDYETFINSAFIVQGRADEFTVKSPAERKRILADLLGLERYAVLEEKAREQSRRCHQEWQLVQSIVAEIDAELSQRPAHETELIAAQGRIELAEERRKAADAELERWRAEQRAGESRAAQLDDLRRRRAQDQQECRKLEVALVNDRAELVRLEQLVGRAVEVEAKCVRLAALQKEDDVLSRRAAELLELTTEQQALEREIARAREELVAELARAEAEAARLQTLGAQADALDRQVEAAEADLGALTVLEAERERQREAAQVCEVEIRGLQDANGRLRTEMNELKERLDLLARAGASCPICLGKLTPSGRDQLEARFEAEGKAKADEFRRNAARLKEIEQRRGEGEHALSELAKRLATRAAIEGRCATLRRQRDEAWTAAGAMVQATERVAELNGQLQQGAFLPEAKSALERLAKRIASMGYDRAEHARLRAEIGELRPYESMRAEVAAAQNAIEPTRDRVARTEELLTSRRAAVATADEQILCLQAEVAAMAEVERHLREANVALDAAVGEKNAALTALGIAQQRLNHCDQLVEQRRERTAAAAKAAEDKEIYDELALAFGRKGIQAMIIENAIPEIEQEANELLGRLTDGQLSLAFETQREAKTGDAIIETLDIKISDAYGTRDYGMYSGGEAFRVDFAIRIALSKLLARRAGAQLQLLVIDEGFGTQDATGRERLVEAINTVSSDFEKILVVTHIQELKDAFPVRIDVVKGPAGSEILATTVLDG